MSIMQPLDFQSIFIGTFSENVIEIFLFASVILLSAMAGKFKIQNGIFASLLVVFILIINYYFELGVLYILTLLLVGIVVFYNLSKMWE